MLPKPTSIIIDELSRPFPPERVHWRVGSVKRDKTKAMALAYIDARDVQDRLNEAVGALWQCRYVPMPNGTTCCEIGICLDGQWVWRSNGAGATDIEGEKGGYSDAFKRAAVMWGVGRYLYDLHSPWVEIDEWKKIKPAELARLQGLLGAGGAAKSPVTNNGSGKSANKSREEWKPAIAALNAAIERGRGAVDAVVFEQSAMVSDWPTNFKSAYAEKVQAAVQLTAPEGAMAA